MPSEARKESSPPQSSDDYDYDYFAATQHAEEEHVPSTSAPLPLLPFLQLYINLLFTTLSSNPPNLPHSLDALSALLPLVNPSRAYIYSIVHFPATYHLHDLLAIFHSPFSLHSFGTRPFHTGNMGGVTDDRLTRL